MDFVTDTMYAAKGADIARQTERARTVFDADGNTQTITWEWLSDGKWLPLCDRVATRIDRGAVS